MFSGRFTIALMVVLGAPLVMRSLWNLEPYPAILLPDGASLIPIDGAGARYREWAIYATRSDGSSVRLNPRELMDPIPAHYLVPVALRGLGQRARTERILKLPPFGDYRIRTPEVSPDERVSARQWLAGRVFSRAPDATAVDVRMEATRCDVRSGECLSEPLGGYKIALR